MKKLSNTAMIIIAIVSLLLTVLFTYLWATLSAPVSSVFAVLVFIAAAVVVISVNIASKN